MEVKHLHDAQYKDNTEYGDGGGGDDNFTESVHIDPATNGWVITVANEITEEHSLVFQRKRDGKELIQFLIDTLGLESEVRLK